MARSNPAPYGARLAGLTLPFPEEKHPNRQPHNRSCGDGERNIAQLRARAVTGIIGEGVGGPGDEALRFIQALEEAGYEGSAAAGVWAGEVTAAEQWRGVEAEH